MFHVLSAWHTTLRIVRFFDLVLHVCSNNSLKASVFRNVTLPYWSSLLWEVCLLLCTLSLYFMCPHRSLQPKGPAKGRAIPSISKSREEEIRKILRANLQKTRQRVGETTAWSLKLFSNKQSFSLSLCGDPPQRNMFRLLIKFMILPACLVWDSNLRLFCIQIELFTTEPPGRTNSELIILLICSVNAHSASVNASY